MSYFNNVIVRVQMQVEEDVVKLVHGFNWLNYDLEINVLIDSPQALNLDDVTKIQIELFLA
mgnify:FL=1